MESVAQARTVSVKVRLYRSITAAFDCCRAPAAVRPVLTFISGFGTILFTAGSVPTAYPSELGISAPMFLEALPMAQRLTGPPWARPLAGGMGSTYWAVFSANRPGEEAVISDDGTKQTFRHIVSRSASTGEADGHTGTGGGSTEPRRRLLRALVCHRERPGPVPVKSVKPGTSNSTVCYASRRRAATARRTLAFSRSSCSFAWAPW